MGDKNFYKKHAYPFLMLISILVMSVAGLLCLFYNDESYFDSPALAGSAIRHIKLYFTEPGEMAQTPDMEETPEDFDAQALESEDNFLKLPEDEGEVKKESTEQQHRDRVEAQMQEQKGISVNFAAEDTAAEDTVSDNTLEFTQVDLDYFNDALFIGDSRQKGFGLYSQLPMANVYAGVGLPIYYVATKPVVDTPLGKMTIADALMATSGYFKKVYIMFGINEMGYGKDETIDAYFYNLIDYIKYTQPDAVIYLESIISVTKSKAASSPRFSLENIANRNEHLKQIAENEHIYYLDLNEILTDEEGYLFEDASSDGVHLKTKYILQWRDYLASHAIVRDSLSENSVSAEAAAEEVEAADGGEAAEAETEPSIQEDNTEDKTEDKTESETGSTEETTTEETTTGGAAGDASGAGTVQAWVNGQLVTLPAP